MIIADNPVLVEYLPEATGSFAFHAGVDEPNSQVPSSCDLTSPLRAIEQSEQSPPAS
jgi:hypothetical protein